VPKRRAGSDLLLYARHSCLFVSFTCPWSVRSARRKNDPVHAIRADAVRAVIFDFDGLLMDTESTSFLSWQYEWSQWGLTLQVADFFVNHGGDVTEDRYARLAAAAGWRSAGCR
jgi:hypothetical protein